MKIKSNTIQSPGHPHYPGEHNDRDERVYFLPDQVVLFIEHRPEVSGKELVIQLSRFLNEPAAPQAWRGKLAPPLPRSVLTFPLKDDAGRVFSLVPTFLRQKNTGQDELGAILAAMARDLRGEPIWITPEAISLNHGAPNWLIGGAYHGIGVGGPGAWPVMATLPPGSWPQFQFSGIPELALIAASQGKGIKVAILDTAPSRADLSEAYDEWRETHPLIESLLKPGGPLNVVPASGRDRSLLKNYLLGGHQYQMPDHGLFAAGVIHTIARQAELYLFEVLNPYGIGCFETIARGLVNVLERFQNQGPLIVNCSYVLDLPRKGHLDVEFPDILRDPGLLQELATPFQKIFDRLARTGVIVVAAAGNDAVDRPGQDGDAGRPGARYPAAFRSVIGVGAAPKGLLGGSPPQPASYSNLADETPDIGYLTLGGEPGEGEGILGVFTGQFPEYCGPLPPQLSPHQNRILYRPNESGWAWWAGTSFATPVISGLLADWWSMNPAAPPSSARDFLDGVAPGRSGANEKVIAIDQTQ